jgi:WD40 repeat protein
MRLRVLAVIVAVAATATACVPDPPPTTTPEPEFRTLVDRVGILYTSASADGRYVAVELASETADFNRVIEVHDTRNGSVATLPEGGYGPEVSDDGRYVAYRRFGVASTDPTVRLWDRSSGAVIELPSAGAVHSGFLTAPDIDADGSVVVWRSGGRCIQFACFGFDDLWSNVYRWDRSTGQTTALTSHPAGTFETTISTQIVGDVEVSADGNIVTYPVTDTTTEPDTHTIRQWRAGAGTTTLATTAGPVAHVSASSNGNRVAYQVQLPDPTDPANATYDVEVWSSTPGAVDPTPDEGNWGLPELSADGQRLYLVSGRVEVFIAPSFVGERQWALNLNGSRTVSTPLENPWPVVEAAGTTPRLILWQPNTVAGNTVTAWAAGL